VIRSEAHNPPAEGEAHEIAPGVFWFQLPLPFKPDTVNVYALREADGWTLVDSGLDTRRTRGIWQGILRGREFLPFAGTIALFVLGYAGLIISYAPYLVPPSLTFWDTAAAPASQLFFLLGTMFLLPIVLGYTIFVYRIFRGRIAPGEGYH